MFKKKSVLMPIKNDEPAKKSGPAAEKEMAAEALCPTCGKEVLTHKCNLCGATMCISQVSGNVIWMRNGRVVAAFTDERVAYVKMAEKYGIPKENYPERFK